MSLRALKLRQSSRIKPFLENTAIIELRAGSKKTKIELLSMINKENKSKWKKQKKIASNITIPYLVEENYFGYNIILYREKYYGLDQNEGAFDIEKIRKNEYKSCFSNSSKADLKGEIKDYITQIKMKKSRIFRIKLKIKYIIEIIKM
jgi:hypothetical protein